MLSRTSLALLRASSVRRPHSVLRTALPFAPSRTYAKVGKPQSPQWANESSNNPSQPPQSKPKEADDPVTSSASLNESRAASDDPAQTSPSEVETETEPAQPLPDLTKGIPSTLEAELRKAEQARGRSHKSSLNITEDPAEPMPGEEDGGGRDRTPRSEYISSSDKKKNAAFKYTYLFLGMGIVGYSLYLGRNWETEELAEKHAETAPNGWGPGQFFNRVKARMTSTMSYYNDPMTAKLLPDQDPSPEMQKPFTLVLSLEDLLVHQEWSRAHGWRIAKRPGVDYFLRYLTQYYELVLFTSQPSAIADQVLRKLDPYVMVTYPLFREATLYKDGGYIKDISYLNRDPKKVVMIDTDAHHVKNQPENAIVLPKWKGDPNDQTLVQLIPFLEYLASMGFDDARTVLKSFEGKYIPAEFARREKLLREKFEAERKTKGKPKRSLGFGSVFKSQSPDGLPSTEEAMAEGKMIWDIIRERGQRNYQEIERNIRELGPKWLAEREAEEKRLQEEAMKNMTRGGFGGWFGGSGGGKEDEVSK